MSAPVCFLTIEQVLVIHRTVIGEFGGYTAIRDAGLLDSAVAVPMAQFGGRYLHDGVAAMAAAYLFHLCKNHAFVDGNKRTALASALTFLLLNGRELTATDRELEELTLGVANGSLTKDDATEFFQAKVVT